MDVDTILLLRLPTDFAHGTAGLLLRVLLGAIPAAVPRGPNPQGVVHAPILVRHPVPADRPVQPGIDGIGYRRDPDRVAIIPGGRARERLRQAGDAIHRKDVRLILGRLVKAAALERAPGMRQVEPLAVIRIIPARLSVIDR